MTFIRGLTPRGTVLVIEEYGLVTGLLPPRGLPPGEGLGTGLGKGLGTGLGTGLGRGLTVGLITGLPEGLPEGRPEGRPDVPPLGRGLSTIGLFDGLKMSELNARPLGPNDEGIELVTVEYSGLFIVLGDSKNRGMLPVIELIEGLVVVEYVGVY